MYIKIYFDNRPLFLCNEIDETIQPYVHHDDAVFIDELNSHTIKSMIHEMEKPTVHAGVFFHPDLEALKKAFFKKFKQVIAAGGLVQNEKKEVLLIFRRGHWDSPKGKMEKKEKTEDCALREVKEETGLKEVRLIKAMALSWHTYHEGTHFILKESHWFSMEATGNQPLQPQIEEDILDLKWVRSVDLEKYMENMFPSVKDVISSFFPG